MSEELNDGTGEAYAAAEVRKMLEEMEGKQTQTPIYGQSVMTIDIDVRPR